MKARRAFVAVLAAGLAAAAAWAGLYVMRRAQDGDTQAQAPAAPRTALRVPEGAAIFDTPHFRLHSTATREETARVAAAVEALYTAHGRVFPEVASQPAKPSRMTLVLYGSRDAFKRDNRSRPWAEAYYLAPASYAYYARDAGNPLHWMLHEVTHQLNTEAAGFRLPRWASEGVACYFGASRYEDGALIPGRIDITAYPVWWLADLSLSGDLKADVDTGRFIPLRQLITGQGGPDFDRHFNAYYVHYWSLSHFLFHHRGGQYAAAYRELLRRGGSLEDFEALIGPVERVQAEWYAYLYDGATRLRALETGEAPLG